MAKVSSPIYPFDTTPSAEDHLYLIHDPSGTPTSRKTDPQNLIKALPIMVGDSGSGGAKGLVPVPASGDSTKFLRGDATWAVVSGLGAPGGSSGQLQYNNNSSLGGTDLYYVSNKYGINNAFPSGQLHQVVQSGVIGHRIDITNSHGANAFEVNGSGSGGQRFVITDQGAIGINIGSTTVNSRDYLTYIKGDVGALSYASSGNELIFHNSTGNNALSVSCNAAGTFSDIVGNVVRIRGTTLVQINSALHVNALLGNNDFIVYSVYGALLTGDADTNRIGIGTSTPGEKLTVNGDVGLTSSGVASVLKLYEPTADGTNYTGFRARTQSANIIYTLPDTVGSSGSILGNDGTGLLTWIPNSSGLVDSENIEHRVYTNIKPKGTRGHGFDTLIYASGFLPASGITERGSQLRIKAYGTTKNNEHDKEVKLVLGYGSGTHTVGTIFLTPETQGLWEIETLVSSNYIGEQYYFTNLRENGFQDMQIGNVELNNTFDWDVKIVAEGSGVNDIVCRGLTVEKILSSSPSEFSSIHLDGTQDLSISNPVSLRASGTNFSIVTWINPDHFGNQVILSKGDPTVASGEYLLKLNDTISIQGVSHTYPSFWVRLADNLGYVALSGTPLPSGQFTRICASFDHGSKKLKMRVGNNYVTTVSNVSGIYGGTNTFRIGSDSTNYFTGIIGPTLLYNKDLTYRECKWMSLPRAYGDLDNSWNIVNTLGNDLVSAYYFEESGIDSHGTNNLLLTGSLTLTDGPTGPDINYYTIEDSVGGNHGHLMGVTNGGNTSSLDIPSIFANGEISLLLGGSGEYVQLNERITPGTNFSCFAWINMNEYEGPTSISFPLFGSKEGGTILEKFSDGQHYISNNNFSQYVNFNSAGLFTGSWHHIGMIKSGESISFYWNGYNNFNGAGASGALGSVCNIDFIGRTRVGTALDINSYATGKIKDIRIYQDQALTNPEVNMVYSGLAPEGRTLSNNWL